MRDQQLDILAIRLAVLFTAIGLSVVLYRQKNLLRAMRIAIRRLSQHPWRTSLLIFVLSLSVDATLTILRYPLPRTHDEFSYLLAGEMFAAGRVCFETHPFWQHFETFHVLHEPSYASKYPPGNGVFLALGQILTGHPIVGVWISLACACVAAYWMFRAWLPASWATLAGLLLSIHDPLHEWWGQTYWGGAVAMLGGSLMFGAIRRIWTKPELRDGVLLATGLVILANSRPMEGLIASLPVFLGLGIWLIRADDAWLRVKCRNVILPLAAIGGLGLLTMAALNDAVTDDPTVMPYTLHDQKYSASSLLIWKTTPQVPSYNHKRLEKLYVDWARRRQERLASMETYQQDFVRKAALLLAFFPIGWGICLPAIPFRLQGRWKLFALGSLLSVSFVLMQLTTSWIYPHYLAPVACLIYVLCFEGLRHLSRWQRQRGIGAVLAGTVVIIGVLRMVTLIVIWTTPDPEHPRAEVQRSLLEDFPAQKHLVIVSYSDDYPIFDEWVYNAADIDAADIVWARDMGRELNRDLVNYYSDREIWQWRVAPDRHRLTKYRRTTQSNPSLRDDRF